MEHLTHSKSKLRVRLEQHHLTQLHFEGQKIAVTPMRPLTFKKLIFFPFSANLTWFHDKVIDHLNDINGHMRQQNPAHSPPPPPLCGICVGNLG
ncbi:hypothetical protein ACTXT7_011223 [Hymenolepis weldensis]